MDIETISLDDVEIIPANVIADNDVTDLTDLTDDVIVVPPATTADVMTPFTSDLLTYSLLQNTSDSVPVTSATVTQGDVSYMFRQDSFETATQVTNPTEVTSEPTESVMPVVAELITPVSKETVTPPVSAGIATPVEETEMLVSAETVTPVSTKTVTSASTKMVSSPFTVQDSRASLAQLKPNDLTPPPPKKPKTDDAVFLTPLPIITYTKAANRMVKHPKPKPSNPAQNQLIKALLAKSTQGTYVARPAPPRGTTSFIIRASTQSPSGKRQIVNLPVSVSTPISIIRNITPGVRPIITHNLLVRPGVPGQGSASRSAFVSTSTGINLPARELVTAAHTNVVTTLTTASMAITSSMTVAPQAPYSISPIITTTGIGTVVTTTVSSAISNPFIFTSTATVPKTKSFPTYTKTYIPVPHFRTSKRNGSTPKPIATPAMTNKQNLVGSRVLPAFSNSVTPTASNVTMLGPRGPFVSPRAPTFVHRPLGHVRTNIVQGYRSKYLEPGEIPQVRKTPPRTFLGPRSSSTASTALAQHQAQMKAARHARHHEESQAQLRALRRHGASRALLHATSLAALQAASHAQLEAAARARLKAQQARLRKVAQSQLSTATDTPLQITSLGQLQNVSLTQPQGALNVQLLTASQAQILASAKMQILSPSQTQLQATSPVQVQTPSSQEQTQANTQSHIIHAVSQVQTQANSQEHIIHAVSKAQFQSTPQVQTQINTQAHIIHAIPQVQTQSTTQAHIIHTVPQTQSNTQAHIIHALSQVQLQQSALQTPVQKTNSQMKIQAATQAHIIHAVSHSPAHTTSQTKFKATPRAQLQATQQAHMIQGIPQNQLQLQTKSQAKHKTTSHSQIQAIPQTHFIHAISQAHLQTTSQAQMQNTAQAHIIHAVSQAQLQTTQQALLQVTPRAQLQTTKAHIIHAVSQAQLQSASQAQLSATSRVQLIHAVSQAQLQATSEAQRQVTTKAHIIHAVPQAQLQATSRTQLQATSRVQLIHAVSQAQLQATSQAQLQATSMAQVQATTQAHIIHAIPHTPLQATSQAQLQATTQAHIIHTIPQAQLQSTTQAQLQTTTQAHVIHAVSQSPLQASSQGQFTQAQNVTSQAQLRGVTRTPPQAMPNSRTHHRLIIRSLNPNTARVINTSATMQSNSDEKLPTTPQQGSETASSSIHTTTTLTLSTGTTLIMPHYKTTLFKNVSNSPCPEPNQLVTPTTTVSASTVETIIHHPVAYFSARRTSESGSPVNVQRHIIRTIPRHILETHLRSARVAPLGQVTPHSILTTTGPQISQVISTSSVDLPGVTTLSQNEHQSTDKNK